MDDTESLRLYVYRLRREKGELEDRINNGERSDILNDSLRQVVEQLDAKERKLKEAIRYEEGSVDRLRAVLAEGIERFMPSTIQPTQSEPTQREVELTAALETAALAALAASSSELKLIQFEWEHNKAAAQQLDIDTLESEAEMKAKLRVRADAIVEKWAIGSGRGALANHLRQLPALLADIHILLPDVNGWVDASSSSSAAASSSSANTRKRVSAEVVRTYTQIYMHIRPDKIPDSDEPWLRQLKSSVHAVLAPAYAVYTQE